MDLNLSFCHAVQEKSLNAIFATDVYAKNFNSVSFLICPDKHEISVFHNSSKSNFYSAYKQVRHLAWNTFGHFDHLHIKTMHKNHADIFQSKFQAISNMILVLTIA